ncbi:MULTISPECIES: hypothetical protein [Bradyrhizobium]|uniref:hypothetical protein n=2 Tax=Nitrobacteraceae TaxID=41294 RepID=UPI001CD81418|nr:MULTISPECIES: hypothetical protein [Bradyrhizobium]MCA1416554.1 hypothetical protein [Bradyrhizobium sp. NBAIM20]MCA1466178.1 hypothetical protein [Bradyrhizobium sp. NBAIM18]MCA1530770.1 hypothetical protein [Bradyrhizobium yuanmingense]
MFYRKARRREVFVGPRISAGGGQAWIEQGELQASFEDSFAHVTREVDLEEYQARVAASRKMSLIMPLLGARTRRTEPTFRAAFKLVVFTRLERTPPLTAALFDGGERCRS